MTCVLWLLWLIPLFAVLFFCSFHLLISGLLCPGCYPCFSLVLLVTLEFLTTFKGKLYLVVAGISLLPPKLLPWALPEIHWAVQLTTDTFPKWWEHCPRFYQEKEFAIQISYLIHSLTFNCWIFVIETFEVSYQILISYCSLLLQLMSSHFKMERMNLNSQIDVLTSTVQATRLAPQINQIL